MDPQIVRALQAVEAFKQEFSGEVHDPSTHTVEQTAQAGERWIRAIVEDRHGVSFDLAAGSGLYIAKPTVTRINMIVNQGRLSKREGIESAFFGGWWNGLAVGLEYPRA